MAKKEKLCIDGQVFTWQQFLFDAFTKTASIGPMIPNIHCATAGVISRSEYLWDEFCARFGEKDEGEP